MPEIVLPMFVPPRVAMNLTAVIMYVIDVGVRTSSDHHISHITVNALDRAVFASKIRGIFLA